MAEPQYTPCVVIELENGEASALAVQSLFTLAFGAANCADQPKQVGGIKLYYSFLPVHGHASNRIRGKGAFW